MKLVTGQVWILYNAGDKKQTKPLGVIEMQKLLLSLKPKRLEDYYLWTPGWTEWQSVLSYVSSDQEYFIITGIPKRPKVPNKKKSKGKTDSDSLYNDDETAAMFHEVTNENSFTNVEFKRPTATTDYGYYFNDFRAEDIDLNASVEADEVTRNTGINNRRMSPRHDFKLEIIIMTNSGKTFRSYSRDISLGGTRLEDPIPKDFLNADLELIIINKFEKDRNKGRLHFKAKIVGDIRNPKSLTFKEASSHMLHRLEKLLEAYIEQSKEQSKSVEKKSS